MQIKRVLMGIGILAIGLMFTGCSTKQNSSNQNQTFKSPLLDNSPIRYAIAYVYINRSSNTITRITNIVEPKKENEDAIVVYKTRFGPDFTIPKSNEFFCNSYNNTSDACDSMFVGKKLSAGAAFWGTIVNTYTAVMSVGTDTIQHGIRTLNEFKIDRFENSIKKHNLIEFQKYFVKLTEEETKIYNDAYGTYGYSKNLDNINLKFLPNDKSGLFKTLKTHPKLRVSADETKIPYLYESILTFKSHSDIKSLYEKDLTKYKDNVAKHVYDRNYTIQTTDTNMVLNNSIDIKIDYPSKQIYVPYKKGVKQNIPIKYTIKYANITNMVPRNIILKDKNLLVSCDAWGKRITVNFTNKTNKFLKVNSLTSYLGNDIQNLQDIINLEIPPLASMEKTLKPFSEKQLDNVSFEEATRKNLSKSINYGYAIKYSIMDTNRNKTLHKMKRYNLMSVLKSYF